MSSFDPTEYKLNSRSNWNSIAPQYHNNWANSQVGPFGSTMELVKAAQIKTGDKVLDIACGTGAVTKQAATHLGNNGLLVGVDMSRTALSIAKQSLNSPTAVFVEMDAENMEFSVTFDRMLCQYGLMFFPNVNKVLKSARKMLREGGKIAIAVHGTAEEVPYFSSIMKPILKHIPDIRPKGAPTVHRFGDSTVLTDELERAGFSSIEVKKRTFSYEAGTFDEYWLDYMHSTANSIRHRIEAKGCDVVDVVRKESEENVFPYLSGGSIIFPWTVLIATAS